MNENAKKILLWNYERGTWQYDVFCLLIVAFIFLTPLGWFSNADNLATQPSLLVVQASDFSPDPGEMKILVQKMTGKQFVEVGAWEERENERGEKIYVIEFR